MHLPTPAIVAQTAVRRLPRWVVVLLCLSYALAGFVGRQPWREVDMEAFGLMHALAQGHSPWLQPHSDGLLPSQPGLLQYWLGAWALQLAPSGWDGALLTTLARLPFIGLLLVSLAALWWAVYGLARLPAAQPVAFAFGGEAQPRDYACALADGALLAFLASLGLAQMGHETSHTLVQLAGACGLFFAVANLGWYPRSAAAAAFISPLVLSLAGAPLMALGLGSLALVLVLFLGQHSTTSAPRLAQRHSWAAWWLLSVATASATAWALQLWPASLQGLGWGLDRDWASFARLLTWFSWPAWPLALWTLWRWRTQLTRPRHNLHLLIPVGLWAAALLASVFSHERDRSLLLSLPAIATLAAFALPTLRRSLGAFVDWLTLIFFTISAITMWVVWLSVQTGFPAKPAANVARLSDGYLPPFEALPFAIALLASAAWLLLVAWRTRRHRAAIWKTLALPAGGTVLGWILLMTLWLPMLDYGRSYAPQVARLARFLPAQPGPLCTQGLTLAQVSALRWHGGWQVLPNTPQDSRCHWLLTTTADWAGQPPTLQQPWLQTANILRPTDRDDQWLLLQRRP